MSGTSSDGTEGPVLIHGIPVGSRSDGSVPIRREVRDLKANYPDQWNVFLLGLERFQKVKDHMPLSYYQIAGIHGLPYQNWPKEDLNGPEVVPKGGFRGFCTHTSVLFLTWHRPYLALFETELHKHVRSVAEDFSDLEGGARYLAAADDFRLPYWDWAQPGKSVFPEEALSTKIKVVRPGSDGKEQDMANPLYSYEFQNPGQPGTKPNLNTTVRYPNLPRKARAKEIMEKMKRNFEEKFSRVLVEAPEKNLTERVIYILQSYERYGPFCHNDWPSGSPEKYGSIEDIHNTVHGITGGGDKHILGHMSSFDYSAFDPIFWLHHANIDRMFAIWQALHDSNREESYVTGKQARYNTFTTNIGHFEDIHTELKPFKDTNNTFWTSKNVKNTEPFGYAYPETQKWKYSTDLAYQISIKNSLRQSYRSGSLAAMVLATNLGKATPAEILEPRAQSLAPEAPLETIKSRTITDLAPGNKYLEWITNLKVQKHALGGSFNVHVFLGPIEESDPTLWPTALNHVGTFAVLGAAPDTGCEKCKRDQEDQVQVSGQIPLTIALAERYLAGLVGGLDVDSVTGYLPHNLHWRGALPDGTEKPRGAVDDLVVSIISNEVTIPADPNELPVYAPTVDLYPQITTKTNGQARGDGTGLTDETQA